MRIAVLADIHGNAPALRATLAELDDERIDAIVSAGDITGGALVSECLALMSARPEPVHWVKGNGERETVHAFDDPPDAGGTISPMAAWGARSLTPAQRAAMASWPIALTLDGVCFCHGTPRSEDEILTRATPVDVLAGALHGVDAALIVGGHTHQQMVRTVGPDRVYANAGSVGYPYEGRPGAFWMLIDDGVPEPRMTAYDLDAALAELRASGYPQLESDLDEALLDPADPAWVAAYFEHVAGRGEDPGPTRRAAAG